MKEKKPLADFLIPPRARMVSSLKTGYLEIQSGVKAGLRIVIYDGDKEYKEQARMETEARELKQLAELKKKYGKR